MPRLALHAVPGRKSSGEITLAPHRRCPPHGSTNWGSPQRPGRPSIPRSLRSGPDCTQFPAGPCQRTESEKGIGARSLEPLASTVRYPPADGRRTHPMGGGQRAKELQQLGKPEARINPEATPIHPLPWRESRLQTFWKERKPSSCKTLGPLQWTKLSRRSACRFVCISFAYADLRLTRRCECCSWRPPAQSPSSRASDAGRNASSGSAKSRNPSSTEKSWLLFENASNRTGWPPLKCGLLWTTLALPDFVVRIAKPFMHGPA